jgi:UDP-N-acetylglucosamine 3-dehydrogenase
MSSLMHVVVIGTGHWGKNILRTLDTLKDAKVVGTATRDYQKILKRYRPEAVVIATPANTHAKIAMECLKLNCHVFIEKPIVMNVNDLTALFATAKQYQRQIYAGYLHLHNPAYQAFKHHFSNLGQIQSVDIVCEGPDIQRLDAGAIWDWGPHAAYILFDLFKSFPKNFVLSRQEISSTKQRYTFTGRTAKTAIYVRLGWGVSRKTLRVRIVGTKGKLNFSVYAKQPAYTVTENGRKCNLVFQPGSPLAIELNDWLQSLHKSRSPQNLQRHQAITNLLVQFQTLITQTDK